MRTYTTTVKSALAADAVIMTAIVTMSMDTGPLHVTTCPYSLTISGDTYIGLGTLAEIRGIKESTDLSTDHLRLTLSGANTAIIAAALGEKVQGRAIAIKGAVFSASYTLLADPTVIWDGTMDNFEIEEYGGTGEGGEGHARVILNAQHFLADRDRPRLGRFNDADHRALAAHSGDLGFEYVETMVDTRLRWGR